MPRRGHPETVGSRVHIRVESLALPVGSGFQPAAGLLPGVWPQSRRTPAKSRRQAESLAPQGRGLAYAQIQAAWMMRHAGAHFCVIGFRSTMRSGGVPCGLLARLLFRFSWRPDCRHSTAANRFTAVLWAAWFIQIGRAHV